MFIYFGILYSNDKRIKIEVASVGGLQDVNLYSWFVRDITSFSPYILL